MLVLGIIIVSAIVVFLLWFLWQMVYRLVVPIEKWPRVPFVPTDAGNYEAIITALNLTAGNQLCDLGCGHAGLLVYSAKKYGINGVGYEISFWPRLMARFNAWFRRVPVKIKPADLFVADLSQADAVYCYLLPWLLEKLEPKIAKEMKPGSRVVTYAFPLPIRTPDNILPTSHKGVNIFVYHF